MGFLYSATGEVLKETRNLRWFMTVSRQVAIIEVCSPDGKGGQLTAVFHDGSIYADEFACKNVLAGFVKRRVFSGADITGLPEGDYKAWEKRRK